VRGKCRRLEAPNHNSCQRKYSDLNGHAAWQQVPQAQELADSLNVEAGNQLCADWFYAAKS